MGFLPRVEGGVVVAVSTVAGPVAKPAQGLSAGSGNGIKSLTVCQSILSLKGRARRSRSKHLKGVW